MVGTTLWSPRPSERSKRGSSQLCSLTEVTIRYLAPKKAARPLAHDGAYNAEEIDRSCLDYPIDGFRPVCGAGCGNPGLQCQGICGSTGGRQTNPCRDPCIVVSDLQGSSADSR